MKIDARRATPDDLQTLVEMYWLLEEEMVGLHAMWPIADGLDQPVEASLKSLLVDPESVVVVGSIEDCPLGFMWGRVEGLLEQAQGEKIGVIRLVYVDYGARQVGVGEAMLEEMLGELRSRGITKFDAHVLPGHRLVKNFFESGGFSARSIVMHHNDDR